MPSAVDMLVDGAAAERRDRAEDPRLRELRQLLARRQHRAVVRDLGTTRWASPPPGMSMRAAVLLLLFSNAGLTLLLFELGYFR